MSKSTKFLALSLCSITLCSCMQDFVEKEYKSTVAGYSSAPQTQESSVFGVTNSTAQIRISANIPVIVTDPRAIGNAPQQPVSVSYNPNVFQPQQLPSYGGNAYGSLGVAPSGVINNNVMMQNTSPVYSQPAFGNNNIYAPENR